METSNPVEHKPVSPEEIAGIVADFRRRHEEALAARAQTVPASEVVEATKLAEVHDLASARRAREFTLDPKLAGGEAESTRFARLKKVGAVAAGVLLTAGLTAASFKFNSDAPRFAHDEKANEADIDDIMLLSNSRPAARALSIMDATDTPAADETDESLRSGGYNCGHTLDAETGDIYNYENQINYLNERPDLAEELMDFHIRDSQWGMGQAAWDVVLDHAYVNENTPEGVIVEGNAEADDYAHLIHRAELDKPGAYVNFTCVDSDGNINIRQVKSMKLTGHVNGFVFDADGLAEFNKVARKGADGKSMFDIVKLDKDNFLVVVESTGCLNPNRVPPVVKESTPPSTSLVETTVPSTSTSTTEAPTSTTSTSTTTSTTTTEAPTTTSSTSTTTTEAPTTTTSTTVPETITTSTSTSVPLPSHPTTSGPPPEGTTPPQPQEDTPGYEPGNAEEVVEQQESETPGGVDPTEHGTPAPEGSPSGEDQIVSEPGEGAPNNPDHEPGSESQGTDEGVNDRDNSDSETDHSDETAEHTEEPLPFDPLAGLIVLPALSRVAPEEINRRRYKLASAPDGLDPIELEV